MIGSSIARTKRPADTHQSDWPKAILLAGAPVAAGYAALWLTDRLFHSDFRLWVVAIKLPSFRHLVIAAIYVVALTLAFLVTARSLASATVRRDSAPLRYLAAVLMLTSGVMVMLGVISAVLFMTGSLITSFDPLSTVIAIKFVPVLAEVVIIATLTWQRTGSHRAGGLITGLVMTLYAVASTATQG